MSRELISQLIAIREEGSPICVVGLGISGIESALCLEKLGLKSICVEKMNEAEFCKRSKFVERIAELREREIPVHLGIDGERIVPLLSGCRLVVLSPGVPLESSVVGAIKRIGVPIISELELGVALHGGPSVVVTGSNGKSTTVTLIDRFLRDSGVDSFLCGNVGHPIISSGEISNLAECVEGRRRRSLLVIEASSYQLEAAEFLKPNVAALLNISENHLERHGSLERYASAKANLFARQDQDDLAIFNADDSLVRAISQRVRAKRAFVGVNLEILNSLSDHYAWIDYGAKRGARGIWLKRPGSEIFLPIGDSRLKGSHNAFNIGVAALAALQMGAKEDNLAPVVAQFVPLEHRFEEISDQNGVVVVNDSKSTTVAATLAALSSAKESYPERSITLLIGGLSKAGSWNPVLTEISKDSRRFSEIICFGGDRRLLGNHCASAGLPHVEVESLYDATKLALTSAKEGQVLLLSPGCASFDEFKDFEHRGREFKRYVNELR